MRDLEERLRTADVASFGHDPRALRLASKDVLHEGLGCLAIGMEDARACTSGSVHAPSIAAAHQLRRQHTIQVEKQ